MKGGQGQLITINSPNSNSEGKETVADDNEANEEFVVLLKLVGDNPKNKLIAHIKCLPFCTIALMSTNLITMYRILAIEKANLRPNLSLMNPKTKY